MKKIVLILFLICFHCFAIDDFANVFKFAKFSSCENIAYKFDTLSKFNGFGKLIEKELQKKTENLFPWRAEVTNGYKEGFFYHTFKGIALENKGDIISAYNEYYYSLSYIDEAKSFVYPGPRHEVELAIANIFLEVGRYYDAQEWFDSIRIEAADKNLAIKADLGLIKRAEKLGDYVEACKMYKDLGTFVKLSREQLNSYAKILFSMNRDRDAFAQLLHGIAIYGFSEELGFKDSLITLFYNALPRATDEEIEWYYDLLGYGINETYARKGSEDHILMLMKTYGICGCIAFFAAGR